MTERDDGSPPPPPPPPDPDPVDFWAAPDDVLWDRKAKQLRYDGLAPLQVQADKWAGTVTALLGIFGTVAFVTGPATFDKLDASIAPLVLVLITLAGVSAALAIALSAFAAQGVPKWYTNLGGDELRDATLASAKRAVDNLRWARWLGLLAAVLLFTSMILVFASALPSATKPGGKSAVVVTSSGSVVCLSLGAGADGTMQVLAPSAPPRPLPTGITSITFIDCPMPTPTPAPTNKTN